MTGRLAMAAALALAGCATAMTEGDCVNADWFQLGQRDGLYGEGPEAFASRADRCAAFGVEANLEDYDAGRARGLRTYCTPDAGFDAGRNGRDYRGVCPGDLEADFLAEYNVGRRLYELNRAVTSAQENYDNAISSLESDKFELRRALERYGDRNLSEEERNRAGRDVDRYRRNIDRLERDIPRFGREIDEAERALADYRAFLDRRARR